MKILKFGGTSVGSASMMDRALDLCADVLQESPVLVSSAMSKVTDALVEICKSASAGDAASAGRILVRIGAIHMDAVREFMSGAAAETCARALDSLLAELGSVVKGLCLIKELSPRSRDTVLSFGERLSTLVLFHRAMARGINAQLVDARDAIKTDENYGSAGILEDATRKACVAAIVPQKGLLVITQGFIGSTISGVTTTLGRGGSDYSATIIGAALGASVVEIWTDVDGIMTTDPRIIPEARVLPEISYEEAAELSYFGAKVIHPSTIQPAIELGIPVWVKNTKNPSAPGTRIAGSDNAVPGGLRAIAGKKGVSLITVRSSHMLNAYGFLKSIFAVFDAHKVSVDLVATSEVSVSMTVDDATHLKAVKKELDAFAEVTVEDQQSIVSLVGKNLWKEKGFLARVFTALENSNIRMVTMGSSDINMSLVIPQSDMERSIRALHDALF